MKLLWHYFEFTIFFAISLEIHHLFREFTIVFAISPRIHYPFHGITIFYYPFHFITVNTLSASWFNYVFTICSANSPWIHYLFRKSLWNTILFWKFTMNTIFVPQIHYLFREWTKNSLWIHYLFCEFPLNSLSSSNSLFFAHLLFFSRIHLESIFPPNHYELTHLLRFSPSFSRIHNLIRELTLNSISFLRNHYEFTIFFAISLGIHHPIH